MVQAGRASGDLFIMQHYKKNSQPVYHTLKLGSTILRGYLLYHTAVRDWHIGEHPDGSEYGFYTQSQEDRLGCPESYNKWSTNVKLECRYACQCKGGTPA